ncbi:MAG: hypothetical protein M1833_002945 [Piccolia ochrophora]|nr:MAG: hypothetical protein M1833_002945 [Piccolia ochrophora]
MMRVSSILCMLALLVRSSLAVFADDAYQNDYHLALLGVPEQQTTFFHQPKSTSRASLLYTLSAKRYLAAVNPKDGSVVWRQRLPSTSQTARGLVRAEEKGNTVCTALEGQVACWDALDGRLVWKRDFVHEEAKDLEVVEGVDGEEGKTALVVLFQHDDRGILRRLDATTGSVKWEFKDSTSSDIPCQISTSSTAVHLISLHATGKAAYKIKVTTVDPVTGKQKSQYTLNSDADVTGTDSILYVGANTASPFIVWTDKAVRLLKVNVIGGKQFSTFDIKSDPGFKVDQVVVHAPHLAQSLPHFLVSYRNAKSHWAEVFHIDLKASTVSVAYSLPKVAGNGVFSTSTQDANVFFVRNTDTEVVLVSSVSHGVLGRWPTSTETNAASKDVNGKSFPVFAVSEVVARSGASYAVRSAVTTSAGEWVLARNGEPSWVRYEALAGGVAAEWVELRAKEDLAKELEYEGHKNVVAAYLHRVKRHARDLQHLPAWLRRVPQRLVQAVVSSKPVSEEPQGLHQDSFGFRKLVVIATDVGQLYALDAGNNGNIVWGTKGIDLKPGFTWDVKGIFLDYGQNWLGVRGAAGDVVIVEIATGKLIHQEPPNSDRRIERTAIVKEGGRNLLIDIYEGGEAGDIPKDRAPEADVTLVTQRKTGAVRGIKYTSFGDALAPSTAWQFTPAKADRTTNVFARPEHDPVASIGKVLGDRSVMYKYLNPNLVGVISVNDADSTASLNLLNSVTGDVLYSTIHKGVDTSRPIPAVMSENWLVYSLWSDSSAEDNTKPVSRGCQLVVAEFFESDIPNDRGPLGDAQNFSSTSPSSESALGKPHFVTQSFVISEGIDRFAVTSTRQGITSRSILATLPHSNAIVAIPKSALDPRRPVGRDPTPAEAEEGLYRYRPLLDLDPKWYLTHKRDVVGVKEVITSPALLESTSLVFAYGLDIFGTRVAPSLSFDILGQGFSKIQLLGTVLALAVGVGVLAPMALNTNGRG